MNNITLAKINITPKTLESMIIFFTKLIEKILYILMIFQLIVKFQTFLQILQTASTLIEQQV